MSLASTTASIPPLARPLTVGQYETLVRSGALTEDDEVVMVAEGAESTVEADRRTKGRLYARAGIAQYWIVNLRDKRVEVHTDPTGPEGSPRYRAQHDAGIDDAITLDLAGGLALRIPVREIVPA